MNWAWHFTANLTEGFRGFPELLGKSQDPPTVMEAVNIRDWAALDSNLRSNLLPFVELVFSMTTITVLFIRHLCHSPVIGFGNRNG